MAGMVGRGVKQREVGFYDEIAGKRIIAGAGSAFLMKFPRDMSL